MVRVQEIPLNQIKRPLPRATDPQKVQVLMESIQAIGQQEPIDVLEVDGQYYGFSGCHRYEACQRLGKETVLARVRKAPKSVLKMHMA
jgi:sulfiredoxin